MRYSVALIEHFRNPRNAGLMREPDGVGEAEYEACMDVARFYLRVAEGRVVEARFQTYGCGPTIAASSAATALAEGVGLEELTRLPDACLEEVIGPLPAERVHAAHVVAAALRAAARDALARPEARREPPPRS
ncbi:MAG: iron-sulfur cluster assembly scaffold protein [Candidatus Rokubacteria bacterium]|nr:iron-sulfur cluster assembly scaffold protein [Candidatus Rokubacteria bacterium]